MAHAVAGRLWLAAGNLDAGTAELDRAGSIRRRGTAAERLAAWEAEGIARLARGDRRGAMAAMRCALAVVNDQQASLGATELPLMSPPTRERRQPGDAPGPGDPSSKLHLAVDGTLPGQQPPAFARSSPAR